MLQALSSHRLRLRVPDSDLKRLFGAVKEGRVSGCVVITLVDFICSSHARILKGHDSKLSDAFYDSLEGVLQDLRTVTIVCQTKVVAIIIKLNSYFSTRTIMMPKRFLNLSIGLTIPTILRVSISEDVMFVVHSS